jgi:hypothetical protein
MTATEYTRSAAEYTEYTDRMNGISPCAAPQKRVSQRAALRAGGGRNAADASPLTSFQGLRPRPCTRRNAGLQAGAR